MHFQIYNKRYSAEILPKNLIFLDFGQNMSELLYEIVGCSIGENWQILLNFRLNIPNDNCDNQMSKDIEIMAYSPILDRDVVCSNINTNNHEYLIIQEKSIGILSTLN